MLFGMRTPGSAVELEHRRLLAVERASEGYSTQEVADFLGVDPSTVRRWLAAFRDRGVNGLAAGPVPGRPRKLTPTQEKIALRWLTDSPMHHGFETELWTAARLGQLIREEFGIRLNTRYLSTWLRDRGFTPQKPQRVARERDPGAIAAGWSPTGHASKKGPAAGRPLALIDESGLLMAPLARRTWAPRGQTPGIVQKSGTARRSRSRRPSGCRPAGTGWGSTTTPWPTATSIAGTWRPSWRRC